MVERRTTKQSPNANTCRTYQEQSWKMHPGKSPSDCRTSVKNLPTTGKVPDSKAVSAQMTSPSENARNAGNLLPAALSDNSLQKDKWSILISPSVFFCRY